LARYFVHKHELRTRKTVTRPITYIISSNDIENVVYIKVYRAWKSILYADESRRNININYTARGHYMSLIECSFVFWLAS